MASASNTPPLPVETRVRQFLAAFAPDAMLHYDVWRRGPDATPGRPGRRRAGLAYILGRSTQRRPATHDSAARTAWTCCAPSAGARDTDGRRTRDVGATAAAAAGADHRHVRVYSVPVGPDPRLHLYRPCAGRVGRPCLKANIAAGCRYVKAADVAETDGAEVHGCYYRTPFPNQRLRGGIGEDTRSRSVFFQYGDDWVVPLYRLKGTGRQDVGSDALRSPCRAPSARRTPTTTCRGRGRRGTRGRRRARRGLALRPRPHARQRARGLGGVSTTRATTTPSPARP